MSNKANVILLLLLSMAIGKAVAQSQWTDYLGSHYKAEEWANSIRDPGGPGAFSVRMNQKQFDIVQDAVGDQKKDIIISAGGLGSGRSQELVNLFLNRMLLDLGKSWKQEIEEKAIKLSRIPHASDHIYWQFGNEINSQRFAETITHWDEGAASRGARMNAAIPYYVEYYLAPGIEALRSAAAQTNSKPFKIILGSVASFANPKAQAFLQSLMTYRVEGLCAPSLKGRTVSELIDVVSVHYIATANVDHWRDALNTVKKQWIDTGKIGAVWSTEELGIQRAKVNGGAVFSAQVVARYLDWWLSQGMNPQQGRAFFWGGDVGRSGLRGFDALEYLYHHLGKTSLERMNAGTFSVQGENIESYGFTALGTDKKIVFVFPKNQKQAANITSMKMPEGNGRTRKYQAEFFSSEKRQANWMAIDTINPMKGSFKLPAMSMLIVVSDE